MYYLQANKNGPCPYTLVNALPGDRVIYWWFSCVQPANPRLIGPVRAWVLVRHADGSLDKYGPMPVIF